MLGLGLAVTHNDTFHETIGLKAKIESTVDYVQYWIGIPYIFTGLSLACSAVNLRKVSLTVWTIFVSLICVVLSLAGLVVDGPDFVLWKDYRAREKYWEGQDGFACSSVGDTCQCSDSIRTAPVSISDFTDCETLMKLSSIYGVLIGCFIIGLVLLLASVFMIVYIVTSEREKARREGKPYYQTTRVVEAKHTDTVFENPVQDYTNSVRNQGYEYPVAPPAVPEPPKPAPSKPAPYRDYKTTAPESVSQHNHDDASSIVDNGGIVMMDPGRFRLGDDDIY